MDCESSTDSECKAEEKCNARQPDWENTLIISVLLRQGSGEGAEERKGRTEEIAESIIATVCREPGDEEFHTAVCGVTSCHLFKQSVAAAGLWDADDSVPCSYVSCI